MDFLDFDDHALYFDEPLSLEQKALLQQASEAYPEHESGAFLDKLYMQKPESLIVLVALYRYYYYQHRYEDALRIAEQSIVVSGKGLGLKVGWERLSERHLGEGVFVSMGMVRFYMLALKGSAYLLMRLGKITEALVRLKKIAELDPGNQFGSRFMLEMAEREQVNLMAAGEKNIQSLFRH